MREFLFDALNSFFLCEEKMKEIECYELLANTDRTEGRGGTEVVGRFVHYSDALSVNNDPRFYKEYGVMGSKSDPKYNIRKANIVIFDSNEDFFNMKKEYLKERALAKLTAEERNLLGL